MKELGVSQTELARRMKVSRPYITKVLRQDVNFSFRTAAKLANALKMDFFPELRPRETLEMKTRNWRVTRWPAALKHGEIRVTKTRSCI